LKESTTTKTSKMSFLGVKTSNGKKDDKKSAKKKKAKKSRGGGVGGEGAGPEESLEVGESNMDENNDTNEESTSFKRLEVRVWLRRAWAIEFCQI
jgi:hypothetical protein